MMVLRNERVKIIQSTSGHVHHHPSMCTNVSNFVEKCAKRLHLFFFFYREQLFQMSPRGGRKIKDWENMISRSYIKNTKCFTRAHIYIRYTSLDIRATKNYVSVFHA